MTKEFEQIEFDTEFKKQVDKRIKKKMEWVDPK